MILYLKDAVAFKLNERVKKVPRPPCTEIDPVTHNFAYELHEFYKRECLRQRDANFEAVANYTPPEQTIPVPLANSGRNSAAAPGSMGRPA